MAKKKTTGEGSGEAAARSAAPATPRQRTSGSRTAATSPLTGVEATTSEEVQLAVAHDTADRGRRQPSYEEIATAAYQRYLSRGGAHGHDFDDWLQAERELQERRTQ
jgi:hypothetical protein